MPTGVAQSRAQSWQKEPNEQRLGSVECGITPMTFQKKTNQSTHELLQNPLKVYTNIGQTSTIKSKLSNHPWASDERFQAWQSRLHLPRVVAGRAAAPWRRNSLWSALCNSGSNEGGDKHAELNPKICLRLILRQKKQARRKKFLTCAGIYKVQDGTGCL